VTAIPAIGAIPYGFSIPAILAIMAILAISGDPLPMYPQPDTHPLSVLLKTNVKVQFDRAVTERSKPFFHRFCQSNQCHFAGLFALVTLCQLCGRQWVVMLSPSTKYQNQVPAFRPTANCQLLTAIFSKSSWRPNTLRRFRSIAALPERINYEQGHCWPCQLSFLARPSGPISW